MLKLIKNLTEPMFVTHKRTRHLHNLPTSITPQSPYVNHSTISTISLRQSLHNLPTSITNGNAQILFKQSVKRLCFTFNCNLDLIAHVSTIPRICYLELYRSASVRRFLSIKATFTHVSFLFC